MTEAKHTPGPWAYSSSSGAIYYDDGDVEPLIAGMNLDSVSVEQCDADGQLIAAAPCLLAAVWSALSAANEMELSSVHFPREELLAAIRKATA